MVGSAGTVWAARQLARPHTSAPVRLGPRRNPVLPPSLRVTPCACQPERSPARRRLRVLGEFGAGSTGGRLLPPLTPSPRCTELGGMAWGAAVDRRSALAPAPQCPPPLAAAHRRPRSTRHDRAQLPKGPAGAGGCRGSRHSAQGLAAWGRWKQGEPGTEHRGVHGRRGGATLCKSKSPSRPSPVLTGRRGGATVKASTQCRAQLPEPSPQASSLGSVVGVTKGQKLLRTGLEPVTLAFQMLMTISATL